MKQAWVSPFLERLAAVGVVAQAARESGICSSAAYALRSTDDDFRAAWEMALEDHTDYAEGELTRRGMGYMTPVLYQGQMVPVYERDEVGQVVQRVVSQLQTDGSTTRVIVPVQARNPDGTLQYLMEFKASDQLLLARVKAYRKSRYAERTEVTGKDGAPLQIDDSAAAARIAQIIDAAQTRKFNDEIA